MSPDINCNICCIAVSGKKLGCLFQALKSFWSWNLIIFYEAYDWDISFMLMGTTTLNTFGLLDYSFDPKITRHPCPFIPLSQCLTDIFMIYPWNLLLVAVLDHALSSTTSYGDFPNYDIPSITSDIWRGFENCRQPAFPFFQLLNSKVRLDHQKDKIVDPILRNSIVLTGSLVKFQKTISSIENSFLLAHIML